MLVLCDYIHIGFEIVSKVPFSTLLRVVVKLKVPQNVRDLDLVHFYLLSCARHHHFDSLIFSSIWLSVQFVKE